VNCNNCGHSSEEQVGADTVSMFVGVAITADRNGSVAREDIFRGILLCPSGCVISMEERHETDPSGQYHG